MTSNFDKRNLTNDLMGSQEISRNNINRSTNDISGGAGGGYGTCATSAVAQEAGEDGVGSHDSYRDMLDSTIVQKSQGPAITLKQPPHPLKKHRFFRYCFCNWRNALIVLFALCLVGGIAGFAAGPTLVLDFIRSSVAIGSPYSVIYKFWLDPDNYGVKTYRKLYLYNITNPYEVVEHGAQPNVVPIGPFVYKEVWKKDPKSVRWFINGTIGYTYKYFMYFQPELSIDEVTGKQLADDKGFNVTILNGPMRGTLFRVGRLPEVVVHVSKKFNITRQEVCILMDLLVDNTILGPKGVFVQRTPHEVFFGYVDPIWSELHDPLALFDYNASTYFQAQWNGSGVAPSPYTYRSGMMCPLWQDPSECNNTGSDITLAVSGSTDYQLLDSDVLQAARERQWESDPRIPQWLQRQGGLLSPHHSQGDVTTWAGQLQGQWWWGPMREGMDGGNEPRPDIINPPHKDQDGEQVLQMEVADNANSNDNKDDNNYNNNNNNTNNNNNELFDPEACRKQYGTDGTRFTMPINDDSILQIFSDFMGRTFPFTYTEDVTYSDLSVKRFAFNYDMGLRASAVNRYCYQMRMDGLINVSQFVFGDGIVTKAGYLDSCVVDSDDMVCVDPLMPDDDDRNASAADGYPRSAQKDDGFCGKYIPFNNTFSASFEDSVTPDKRYSYDDFLKKYVLKDESIPYPARQSPQFREYFESFLDVLPLTGTTLNARASGQISLVLGPIFVRGCGKYLSNFTDGMPRTIIPYMRLDRTATVGGEALSQLKERLLLLKVAYILCGLGIGTGFVGLILIVLYQKRALCCWKNRETSTSSDEDE